MGVTYHSSVLPAIMAVGLLYYVEKLLNRLLPEMIKGFMMPMISIVVVSFAVLLVFGPVGAIVGKGLAVGYEWLYGHSAILAGAALAVMVKSKDKVFRTTCASAALSAVLGITEPAMFGVNLPRKKPMIAVCIGDAVGGAIGTSAVSFVLLGAASMPVFLGTGFGMLMVASVVGMAVAFGVTLVMDSDL